MTINNNASSIKGRAGMKKQIPLNSNYPNTRGSQKRDVINESRTDNMNRPNSQNPDESTLTPQVVDESSETEDQQEPEETNSAKNKKIGNCEKIILKYAKELALTRAKIFSSIKKREKEIINLKEIQKVEKNIPSHFLSSSSIKGLPRDDAMYDTIARELIKKRIADLESKKKSLEMEYDDNIRKKHESLFEDWKDMILAYPDIGIDYDFPGEAYFYRIVAEQEFKIIHEFREREKLHVARRESKKNAFMKDQKAKEEELADLTNLELKKLVVKTANQVFQLRQGKRGPKNTPPEKHDGKSKKSPKKKKGKIDQNPQGKSKKPPNAGKGKGKGKTKKLD